jgi:nicotinamide-nucleotide amidase
VGGPEPEGDEPAGSVYAAVLVRGDIRDAHFQFDGDDPSIVVHQTVRAALELLRDALPPDSPHTD